MFTGLVEEVASVKNTAKTSQGAKLCVECTFAPELKTGDSISLNGACQTVVAVHKDSFEVEAMPESLRLTNLENAKKVNVERAMQAKGRFDGHFVSGHIDGTAKLVNARTEGFSTVMRFEYPTSQIVLKGSVCVNGVSLTVSGLSEKWFEVSLIPHTLANTNLKYLQLGDIVNIETDILAKYIEKMLKTPKKAIDENFLKEHGFGE